MGVKTVNRKEGEGLGDKASKLRATYNENKREMQGLPIPAPHLEQLAVGKQRKLTYEKKGKANKDVESS